MDLFRYFFSRNPHKFYFPRADINSCAKKSGVRMQYVPRQKINRWKIKNEKCFNEYKVYLCLIEDIFLQKLDPRYTMMENR